MTNPAGKHCWWVTSDPCGLFCAGLTWFLLLFALIAIFKVVLEPQYGLFSMTTLAYTIVTALALVSHCKAQFSDPGAVPFTWTPPKPILPPPPPPSEQEDYALSMNIHETVPLKESHKKSKKNKLLCDKCFTIKPKHVHHCSCCNRCIYLMDHHCPWVNNCVAIFNQKYFILFLFYTSILCVFCAIMLIKTFIKCSADRSCRVGHSHVILGIFNMIEAFLFGMFTIIMLFDQIGAIFDNTPYIDSLKNIRGVKRPKMESLAQVFGEPLSWRWLFPFSVPPRLYQEFSRVKGNHYAALGQQFVPLEDSNDKTA